MGVEQNGKKALKWFSRAAARGQVQALFAEGKLYDEGAIVERNDLLAYYRHAPRASDSLMRPLTLCSRYKQAADAEYPKAYRPLADFLYEGRAVPKNVEQAMQLYKKAAKFGDKYSQKKCGLIGVVFWPSTNPHLHQA